MRLFVDTSALLALLDRSDPHHEEARDAWQQLLADNATLLTSNYVAVESLAVAQHRFGLAAARTLVDDLLPLMEIQWVDEVVHDAAVLAVLTAGRRHLSVVDCCSFLVARQRDVDAVFTLDRHFAEQGFSCLP